jgi:PIN domain-containing protein
MAGKIVVDTSVLIKWIKTKDEELLLEAHRLLNRIEARHLDVHVPALLLYETGNILLLKTDLDASGLDAAIDGLEGLPFIVAPPATPLLTRSHACSVASAGSSPTRIRVMTCEDCFMQPLVPDRQRLFRARNLEGFTNRTEQSQEQ